MILAEVGDDLTALVIRLVGMASPSTPSPEPPSRRQRAPNSSTLLITWPTLSEFGALLAGIAGLAVLNSFNPATIAAVAMVVLLAPDRPPQSATAVVVGAYLTVLGIGLVVFLSAGAAAAAVHGLVILLRFAAFGAAGMAFVVSGVHRLKDQVRKSVRLPSWFTPNTAISLGAGMSAADLPNAYQGISPVFEPGATQSPRVDRAQSFALEPLPAPMRK